MEPVPAYLLLHFLRIRRHGLVDGWLADTLKHKPMASAVDEVCMLREPADLHLVSLAEAEDELVFEQAPEVAPKGVGFVKGTKYVVRAPRTFPVLARGRAYWSEVVTRLVGWALASAVGAVVATLATIGIAGGR